MRKMFFFQSWAHHSVEQSSYEIIFIELGIIQKIPLAEWRLFYFIKCEGPVDFSLYGVVWCIRLQVNIP